MNLKYAVIFEEAPANWAAWVPDFPGCMTTGKTLEQTKLNIQEAIQGHLETMKQYGDTIPTPTSRAAEI
jgi:predicted RNase H-like HicB family nuclease